jgi:hypothetical protein
MSSPEIPELGLRKIPEVTLVSQTVRACPCAWVPNRVFIRFPNQQFFRSSDYQQLRFRAPACSWLLLLPNQDSRTLHIREFETSQVPDFWESRIPCSWKTCFENFVKLNVSRVTGFLEFPNMIQQHFVKNCVIKISLGCASSISSRSHLLIVVHRGYAWKTYLGFRLHLL